MSQIQLQKPRLYTNSNLFACYFCATETLKSVPFHFDPLEEITNIIFIQERAKQAFPGCRHPYTEAFSNVHR